MPSRKLRLLQAVSLNMSMMVGIGPFITIPALVDAMGGPWVLSIWGLAALVALCDGLVWSELASAYPGTGGTYHFYDAAYGESRPGRLLKFLFVWQFLFSGPLEIATGAIGLAQHLVYFLPAAGRAAWNWGSIVPGLDAEVAWFQVVAMGVMALVTALAYRRIENAGRLMVVLWAGMLATVGWVIVAGLSHFDPSLAFGPASQASHAGQGPWRGVGIALTIAMYDLLGYYQVCYLGNEVDDPGRTMPRSILISVAIVATLYLAINASILGVLPGTVVVESRYVASDLMRRVYGDGAARLITLMIMWTALAATFAALLGYSRVPFASARAGNFFRAFGALHPTGSFPHRSLLLIGGIASLACLVDLETLISALLASRIIIQFIGQIATLALVRGRIRRGADRPFRMPLYPVPSLIALGGWLLVLSTSPKIVIAYSFGSLLLGALAYQLRERYRGSSTP